MVFIFVFPNSKNFFQEACEKFLKSKPAAVWFPCIIFQLSSKFNKIRSVTHSNFYDVSYAQGETCVKSINIYKLNISIWDQSNEK